MSDNGYVALSEKVTATFYDDEHEEWTQKTATIADVLDNICDDYTVIPSAQPERKTGRWIDDNCSECGQYVFHGDVRNFCPNCGAKMENDL